MDLKYLTEELKLGTKRARLQAAKKMGRIQTPERSVVRALIHALQTDEAFEVRSAATRSLGILEDPLAIRPVSVALSQDRIDGESAENTLMVFGDRAFGPLSSVYWEAESPDLLYGADRGIGEPKLIRALQFKDPKARAYAAYLLGERFYEKALHRLAGLLMDPIEKVRSLAANAIVRIERTKTPLVESILPSQLTTPDWRVREAVLKVLPDLNPRLAAPVIRKFVADPDFRTRIAAVAALKNVIWDWPQYQLEFAKAPQLLVEEDQLVSRLAESVWEATTPDNYSAAATLVGLRSPEAPREIIRGLDSDDAQVRAAMAEAVRDGIAERNTNQPGGWFQRGSSAKGDLQIGDQTQAVINKLIDVTSDPYPGVQKVALEALGNIKGTIDDVISGRKSETVQPETKTVAQPEKVSQAIDETLEAAKPLERHADATFYDGGKQKKHRVPDNIALVVGEWYLFEVAVRTKRTGVPVREGKERSVVEPHQKDPVKLLVTLEADGFQLEDAVQELVLPPTGDSTENAWFQLCPQHKSTGVHDLAMLRVRVYYKFNLLEIFTVHAEIAGKLADSTETHFSYPARTIQFDSRQREYIEFDDIEARSMHIEVRRSGADYQLTFTLESFGGQELALTGATRLKATDIEDMLEQFRGKFESIATSETYLQGVKGRLGEFQNALHDLAKIGRRLWSRLFRDKPGSSLDVIGRRLQREPLPAKSLIQISVQEEAGQFLLPWSLLYDRPLPDAVYKTEIDGFWGLRYPIEQRVANIRTETDAPIEVAGALRLLFMLWEDFRNTQSQLDMMDNFKMRAGKKLEISKPPVTTKEDFYQIAGTEAHILYFYTHGHTRHRLNHTDPHAWVRKWVAWYEELPEKEQESHKSLYEAYCNNRYEIDSSWIELSHGVLYLDEMEEHIRFLPGHPLVILNMCESAQIVPTLADSFVKFFLDRNACTVIGTECPMTVEFAHPFAKCFFEGILAGRRVGEVLVDTRRHFMTEEKNPLGLAYTLFGSAAATFVPPRF